MRKPTDFYMCSSCFTVFDSAGNCNCPPRQIRGNAMSWARYLLFNNTFPLIPEVGKQYPMPDAAMVSRDNIINCLALDDDMIEEFYI